MAGSPPRMCASSKIPICRKRDAGAERADPAAISPAAAAASAASAASALNPLCRNDRIEPERDEPAAQELLALGAEQAALDVEARLPEPRGAS